jgi:uncharacterized membrane protein (UPF0127 family)
MAIKKANYTLAAIIILATAAVAGALTLGSSGDKPKSAPKQSQPSVVSTSCGPYRKDGVVTVNGSQINVETVAASKDLVKGLSGRPCIESNWGMLFDFGRDGQYAIWMKDMKFPIDVAWIGSADKKVVALEINFKPSTYPERRVNQTPARYVLEIAANKSKELKMDIGTTVHFQKTN